MCIALKINFLRRLCLLASLFWTSFFWGSYGWSADFVAQVSNDAGEPVAGAVVFVTPEGGYSGEALVDMTIVDQVNKEFVPAVTAIFRGTKVSFPNSDNVRHHVYSFSRGNAFEIPLYADDKADPVVFENPGVVALGCNVHDWMSAHLVVLDTPYFAITDASGTVALSDMPAGNYDAQVWHVEQRGGPGQTLQTIALGDQPVEIAFKVKLKRAWTAWREVGESGAGY